VPPVLLIRKDLNLSSYIMCFVRLGSSFGRTFFRRFLVSAQDRSVDRKAPQAALQSGEVRNGYLSL
jgi:hypothetical protein